MRIPGEGPTPCDYMFIGEYPGVEEVRVGRPFVGKSGRELRRYLNGYQLPEADDIYLTNLKKDLHDPKKVYVLTPEDEVEIWKEIARVRPKVIVTLGSHVTKYFLGDDATLEATYGIPHTSTHLAFSKMVNVDGTLDAMPALFPSYNPAAMLHSPKMQAWFADGMKRLELFLKGKLPAAPVDEHPGTYMDISAADAWAVVGKTIEGFDVLSCDTEGWTYRPWGASVSGEAYVGYVAKAGTPGWKRLREHIARKKVRLRIHNSLHDLGVLRAMDLDLDALEIPYDDTMVQAYLLGLEPQGLKPLARRHAGMEQSEYSDIVAVPNARIAEQWLHDLVERLPSVTVYDLVHIEGVCGCGKTHKTGSKQIGRPFVRNDKRELSADDLELARVRGLIEKMLAKNEPATLRKRWDAGRAREILVDELYYLDTPHADPPDATLDDIDERTAVKYSGRDADATTRVGPPLSAAIDAMGLRDAYNADMGALPMIDRMQTVGLDADLAHFKSLHDLFAVEQVLNREEIQEMVGRDLNPNSGDQVAELLYDQLKLDKMPGAQNMRIKRTDSGTRLSTNDKILDALSTLHPVVNLIQEGREIGKMDGTYARPMAYLIGQDGRLHPRYRITQTETGRLSAADPNVLALPKHSARGKLVRMGFRAGPGRVLSEWDLCLDPNTRVLRSDLRWVPIKDVRTGDRLVALDEHPHNYQCEKKVAGSGGARRMRTATVERTAVRRAACRQILMSDGAVLVSTHEHPWLAYRQRKGSSSQWNWTYTRDLKVGDTLWKYVDVWDTDMSWSAGWLAGMFDGEGSLSRKDSSITITQNEGDLLDTVQYALRDRGYDFHDPAPKKGGYPGSKKSKHLWMSGTSDVMHLLGTVRPFRLMKNVEQLWEGKVPRRHRLKKMSPQRLGSVHVVAIVELPTQEVVSIQTSTRTFIAEGFFTHNCQIEMCVFAHDSGDERMIEEIRSGVDKHIATAATIFNKPISAIAKESEERFAAKAVNFGILMGITPFGLLDQFHKNKQMHWTMDMTEDLLHDWMRAYPQAATYIELKHAEARRYGFVRDMWGRLRWLEGIHSYDDYIRAGAERQAQATPTQSGAQGIIKRSMGALWPILKEFRRQGMWVEALLQVHDALVLEHAPEDTAIINDAVMMCLTEVVTLKVPIKAAAHTGVLRLGEL